MRTSLHLAGLLRSPLPLPASWYALPLRAVLGVGFFLHGYAKLSRGTGGFIATLEAMHVPLAGALGRATVLVELVGGALIVLGALVPPVTVLAIVVLATAIVTVHLPYGFSSVKLTSYDASGAHFGPPGYEVDLLYIAGLVALCIAGPGPLSIDGWLARRAADKGRPRAP